MGAGRRPRTESQAAGRRAEVLITLWIPHSYPASAQRAPDEHLLAPLARQAPQLMAALFWDLGERRR